MTINARILIAALLAAALPITAQERIDPVLPADFQLVDAQAKFEPPLDSLAASIDAGKLKAHIDLLASASLEGRGLGSNGLESAAEYIVASLRLSGVQPFGETTGSFEQRLPVRAITTAGGSIEIEGTDGAMVRSRTFEAGVDCVMPPAPRQTLRAPVVFVRHGIREPQLGHDDYAGVDARGRIVLVESGMPGTAAFANDAMRSRYGAATGRDRWKARIETAAKAGAIAVLAIEDDPFWARAAERQSDEERAFRAFTSDAAEPLLIRVSRSTAAMIVAQPETSRAAAKGAALPVATIRISGEERLIAARNLIGIIQPEQPDPAGDAILIGAHYDHLGRTAAGLHHGADDNASGVAALLEIARALAASPVKPKRAVIFAFWTGEEEGHLGSEWYAKHPRWPIARTAAYLNLDMIGHPWLPSEIAKLLTDNGVEGADSVASRIDPARFVEPGLPRNAALERAVRRSAAGNQLAMHLDWTSGTEGGSDYRAFARLNVPFIRFFGNFFPDYHKPGDTADRLDAAQVQRVARFALAALWEVANQ